MQHYMDSKQGADQSTVSFNSYLMGLESQLDEPYTETQLRNHLWCKLRPEIRDYPQMGHYANNCKEPKKEREIAELASDQYYDPAGNESASP
ncbi:gag polymerase env protein [Venturia nashicola]|uniref:Gag polymerase env protein n=1 Tax=Venturia nashicola TaxID=86259 RepID=A0A4Z1P8P2_9PEZI|nr:gag polymerase env protein [Venturia nashicola]